MDDWNEEHGGREQRGKVEMGLFAVIASQVNRTNDIPNAHTSFTDTNRTAKSVKRVVWGKTSLGSVFVISTR